MELEKRLKVMEKRVITTKAQFRKVIDGLSFIKEGYKVSPEEIEILNNAYDVLIKLNSDLMFTYEGENEFLQINENTLVRNEK